MSEAEEVGHDVGGTIIEELQRGAQQNGDKSAALPQQGTSRDATHRGKTKSTAAVNSSLPLKPGWKEYFDQRTKCYYYYNAANNVTTWKRPTAEPETDASTKSNSAISNNSVPSISVSGAIETSSNLSVNSDEASKKRASNRRHSGVFSTINSHHMSTDRFSVHLLRPEQRTHVTQEHVRRVDPMRNLTSYAASHFQRHKRGVSTFLHYLSLSELTFVRFTSKSILFGRCSYFGNPSPAKRLCNGSASHWWPLCTKSKRKNS